MEQMALNFKFGLKIGDIATVSRKSYGYKLGERGWKIGDKVRLINNVRTDGCEMFCTKKVNTCIIGYFYPYELEEI